VNRVRVVCHEIHQRRHHGASLRRWLPLGIGTRKVQERALHLSVLGMVQGTTLDRRSVLWISVLGEFKVGERRDMSNTVYLDRIRGNMHDDLLAALRDAEEKYQRRHEGAEELAQEAKHAVLVELLEFAQHLRVAKIHTYGRWSITVHSLARKSREIETH